MKEQAGADSKMLFSIASGCVSECVWCFTQSWEEYQDRCQRFDVALEKWWKSNTDLCSSSSNPGVCTALFLSFGKDDPGSGDVTTLLLSGLMLAFSLSYSSTRAMADIPLALRLCCPEMPLQLRLQVGLRLRE